MDDFQATVACELGRVQPDHLSLDEQWTALRNSLLTAGESVLGRCHRKQPDWYCDSSNT